MRKFWSFALPAVGLLLFAAMSLHSVRWKVANFHTPYRYFWWGSVRLDKMPRQPPRILTGPVQCNNPSPWNCVSLKPVLEGEPDAPERILIILALPAFAVGALLVAALSHAGVSEMSSFLVVMPLSILCWFYGVGRAVDGLRLRYSRRSQVAI
jgi:hypothetical protein